MGLMNQQIPPPSPWRPGRPVSFFSFLAEGADAELMLFFGFVLFVFIPPRQASPSLWHFTTMKLGQKTT